MEYVIDGTIDLREYLEEKLEQLVLDPQERSKRKDRKTNWSQV